MPDVIVIGGGPAGVTAALRARELGASVTLVERSRLGGTCTNEGCVPTRVLARAARLLRDSQQFADYGLIGEPLVVDFPKLLTRTHSIVAHVHEKKQLLAHLQSAGVTVREQVGEARFVDSHTIRCAHLEEALQADTFLLCVGGHARDLPFPGSVLALAPTDLWYLKELPRSLAIVGASATGCQIASIMAAFGSDVTLLEMAPRLLPGEDTAVSDAMADSFARHNIRVVTGIGGVERVEREEAMLRLFYRAAPGEERTEAFADADVVLTAVGWPGNVDALNLEAAGVKTERGYVVVDDALRTSAPHIFAAGDITGRMLLVQSAYDEARVAAENAVLGNERTDTHRIVPHGGFTDPEYGSVGLTEEKARQEEPNCIVAQVPYADLDRSVIDGRTDGFCKLIVSRSSHRILGAHVVGEQALEVVQIVAAAMASGGRVDQLADLELAYPTFSGIVGLAARHLCREMGVICRAVGPASPALLTTDPRATEWEHRSHAAAEPADANEA